MTTFTVAVGPAPLVDADGDGVLGSADCNDANAAIHPGARDVPANGIDEDCDHVDARVRLDPPIRNRWAYAKTFSTVLALKARNVPAGAAVEVRCSGPRPRRRTRKNRKVGCPFDSRKWPRTRKQRSVNLLKPFANRKLPVRTVLEMRITAPGGDREARQVPGSAQQAATGQNSLPEPRRALADQMLSRFRARGIRPAGCGPRPGVSADSGIVFRRAPYIPCPRQLGA